MPDTADDRADETSSADARLLELFDVLGRRWALRVVWELRTGGLTYRDLASKIPDMSTSVLTQRLRDLRTAGLVNHERGSGYRLTSVGLGLLGQLEDLRNWTTQVGFPLDSQPNDSGVAR